jgi:hypothetical protein
MAEESKNEKSVRPASAEMVTPEVLMQAANDYVTELTRYRDWKSTEGSRLDATKVIAFPIAMERFLLQALKGESYSWGSRSNIPTEELLADFDTYAAASREFTQQRNNDPEKAERKLIDSSGGWSSIDARDAHDMINSINGLERASMPSNTDEVIDFHFYQPATLTARCSLPFHVDIHKIKIGKQGEKGSPRQLLSLETTVYWDGSHDRKHFPESFFRAVEEINKIHQKINGIVEFREALDGGPGTIVELGSS